MTAAITLLAVTLAAPPGPLPDGKSFDALTYAFGAGAFGPGGAFGITADGKVSYFYSSAPHTGSGGHVVQKEWTLTKEEKAELFGKLVEAGLLDLPEGHGVPFANGFVVSTGKWRLNLSSVKVPDKVMALLRPLLAKADPELWAEKPEPKPSKPEPVVLKSVGYTFMPKAKGEPVSLNVYRNGLVQYRRINAPNAPDGRYYAVVKDWKLTAKEAEALLDALTADGLFDLEDTGGGKYPYHQIIGSAGRWNATFYPKELPEKVSKHLLPLLKKADPEFWK
jgi:hypothetical protein